MPITTQNVQPEPDESYEAKGPPSAEELAKIIDNIPNGGVPGRIEDEYYTPDEPGEPGWPAAPVKDAK